VRFRGRENGLIGQTVSHYRITAELGRGGMGVVYEAEDQKLPRKVALKFLPPELTRDAEAKRRFVNEAEAASSLQHPNLCTIFEIDETEDGRLFLAMPCYEGQTLKEKLSSGPLPIDEALDIARQLASGLAKAHGRGIVHRDVKPGNVFLTEDGHAVLLDFGLAKLSGATQLTRTGTTVGTPAYLSPEQSRGRETDARTDIWALGVVMYEMLGGRLPFGGDHPQALIYAIQHEEPRSLPEVRAEVPAELARIVQRCLAKDPTDRHASADELREDLERLSRGEGLRLRRRRRRWPVLLPVVLVGAIAVLWLARRGGEPLTPAPADRKSIAVMPFQNLTGDSQYDVWILGLPELLNTELSNSQELRVLDSQTLQSALGEVELAQAAALSVPQMRDVGTRTLVETLITGSLLKAGPSLRIQLKLLDAGTGASLATMRVDGRAEDDFFAMADSLTAQVRDFLEIDTLKQWNPEYDWAAVGTQSAEAYRLYLEGAQARSRADFTVAIDKLKRAVAIDSSFIMAWLDLAGTTANSGDVEGYFDLYEKLRGEKDKMPLRVRYLFELSHGPQTNGCDRGELLRKRETARNILDLDPQSRIAWQQLGFTYLSNEQYAEAADAYAQVETISARLGNYDMVPPGLYHWHCGVSFLRAGQSDKAAEIFTRGLRTPLAPWFEWWLALLYHQEGDTSQSALHLERSHASFDRSTGGDHLIRLSSDALFYAATGDLERALSLCRRILDEDPDDWQIESVMADLLIEHDIDVQRGVAILESTLERHPELANPTRRIAAPWARHNRMDVLGTLGWGYHKLGLPEKAVEKLEAACEQWFTFDATLTHHLELARAALNRERPR
jgi:TolB-like protein